MCIFIYLVLYFILIYRSALMAFLTCDVSILHPFKLTVRFEVMVSYTGRSLSGWGPSFSFQFFYYKSEQMSLECKLDQSEKNRFLRNVHLAPFLCGLVALGVLFLLIFRILVNLTSPDEFCVHTRE